MQRRKCRLPELLAELEASPRNGSRWFRAALADAEAGARSVAEADALRALTDGKVPRFEMNVPVQNERGELIFVVDVLWRELRAVLEIDSREYHLGERARLKTMDKHNALTGHNFAVIHHAPSVVRQPGWAKDIGAWVRARSLQLGIEVPLGHGALAPPPGQEPPPVIVRGLRRPPDR